MVHLAAAEGVHRLEDAYTNWYVVEDGDALTVVDTGHPRSWGSLQDLLRRLGRGAGAIEAVVLTHGHFDHIGFAERARAELRVAGDALVTYNVYTASTGPQIVAGAATADSAQALSSLDALAATGAETVLTGHGDPWTRGAASAVERAHAAGSS